MILFFNSHVYATVWKVILHFNICLKQFYLHGISNLKNDHPARLKSVVVAFSQKYVGVFTETYTLRCVSCTDRQHHCKLEGTHRVQTHVVLLLSVKCALTSAYCCEKCTYWPCDLDRWPLNSKTVSLLGYPKVILYTEFEHFGIIRFSVMFRTNKQTNKQTAVNILSTPTDSVVVDNNI